MSNPLIQAVDLVKFFETKNGTVHAVDHVDLSIDAGKTLGVVGESGCGKTTLGRCMINLIPATSGQILLNGQDILSKDYRKKQLRKDLQIIFQDPYSSLDPRKTVANIIAEPLIANRICKSRAERKERVAEIGAKVFIAGAISFGHLHARIVLLSISSAMPCAILAHTFAVAGATRTRSARSAKAM